MSSLNSKFNSKYISADYIFYGETKTGELSAQAMVIYFLLFNQLIPLALSITMEGGKIATSYFIEHDAEMYSLEEDRHCQCLNLNIHEDLGIVKHIFADKTGTLTNNSLTFKGATIAN